MKKEQSFGILPLRERNGEWEILLVEHLKGHWSFPKGRLEKNEDPQIGAERELMEETGLEVEQYLVSKKLNETYTFFENDEEIEKKVHYFVAKVKGQERPQPDEIKTCRWVSLEDGAALCTYKNTRALVQHLQQLLEAYDSTTHSS
jgi:8-oxo-dGTP pyrophosphatase MutT (NUDIX family)